MASTNGSNGRTTADLETAVAAAKEGDFGPLDGLLAQARQDAPSSAVEEVQPAPVSPYQLAQQAHDDAQSGDGGPAHAAPEPTTS